LTNLSNLSLRHNLLKWLPSQIGLLTNLNVLVVCDNRLTWLPHELAHLTNLKELWVRLFVSSHRSLTCCCSIDCWQSTPERRRRLQLFHSLRQGGLQDLGLPALVTLEIVDQSMPDNEIRMWAKWELITAAKHFHERRGIEPGTSIVAPRSRLSLFLRRFMR